MAELVAFRVSTVRSRRAASSAARQPTHAIGRTIGVRKPGSTPLELKTFNDTNSPILLVKNTNSFSATEHARAGGLVTIRSLYRLPTPDDTCAPDGNDDAAAHNGSAARLQPCAASVER